jgi:hypothetical protein
VFLQCHYVPSPSTTIKEKNKILKKKKEKERERHSGVEEEGECGTLLLNHSSVTLPSHYVTLTNLTLFPSNQNFNAIKIRGLKLCCED